MPGITNNQAFSKLIGHSPALDAVIRTAQIAAATDVHILIEGETGTGKELLAKAIQETSIRADKPFVTVNCAALPADLIESLLFGHEQGAFTGAIERKDGYLQKADGGTLFLDEIGELPLALQAKLLRFIEYGECQRLGSHEVDVVDVRIVAATNRNLLSMVDTKEFRQDLFYRLSVVTLRMPPIHERTRDIPELVNFFLQQAAERNDLGLTKFSSEAMDVLKKYAWPGNVRELRNVCEHVAALMPGETVSRDRLPIELRIKTGKGTSETGFELPEGGINLESLEIDLINQALEKTSGNKSKAARMLGLSRDAFLYRIKKHNL
jgi:transcriptional regulator with PAS, ATPase and Fis domain